jgi:hypothetical protein
VNVTYTIGRTQCAQTYNAIAVLKIYRQISVNAVLCWGTGVRGHEENFRGGKMCWQNQRKYSNPCEIGFWNLFPLHHYPTTAFSIIPIFQQPLVSSCLILLAIRVHQNFNSLCFHFLFHSLSIILFSILSPSILSTTTPNVPLSSLFTLCRKLFPFYSRGNSAFTTAVSLNRFPISTNYLYSLLVLPHSIYLILTTYKKR